MFAFGDAVRRYRGRSSCWPTWPPDASATSSSSSLRHAMSLPLNALEGYASPSLRETLERSAVLAERLDEPRLLVLTLVALFAVRFVQGDVAESYRIGERRSPSARRTRTPRAGALRRSAALPPSSGGTTLAVEHFDSRTS